MKNNNYISGKGPEEFKKNLDELIKNKELTEEEVKEIIARAEISSSYTKVVLNKLFELEDAKLIGEILESFISSILATYIELLKDNITEESKPLINKQVEKILSPAANIFGMDVTVNWIN